MAGRRASAIITADPIGVLGTGTTATSGVTGVLTATVSVPAVSTLTAEAPTASGSPTEVGASSTAETLSGAVGLVEGGNATSDAAANSITTTAYATFLIGAVANGASRAVATLSTTNAIALARLGAATVAKVGTRRGP